MRQTLKLHAEELAEELFIGTFETSFKAPKTKAVEQGDKELFMKNDKQKEKVKKNTAKKLTAEDLKSTRGGIGGRQYYREGYRVAFREVLKRGP